jgi:hypothetical protein
LSILVDRIRRVRSGAESGEAMIEAFRDAVLLVPQAPDGTLMAADSDGICWLLAFSGKAELATWVLTRGGDGEAEHGYLSVRGDRLLDVAVPATGVPTGVAIDVAGEQPMLLPPVRGVVPASAAVDGR